MTPASSTASPEIDRGLTSSIRLYLKRRKRLERFGLKRFARWLRKRYEQGRGVVKIPIHGREMFINAGNPYPFILLDHPFFNRPLTTLVKAVANAKGRKVTVIDCGASIGNTVVQLSGECGHAMPALGKGRAQPEAQTPPYQSAASKPCQLPKAPGATPPSLLSY